MSRKEFKEFINQVLPEMTPRQQRQALAQIVRESDKELRELAIKDPLSKIPQA